jgi:glycosyltransferase involved in cell wall biosynthesis
MARRIKIGVISDEFFERDLGRMGGYGWAARQLSRTFNDDPSLGVEVVFLSGELRSTSEVTESRVHDTRLIFRRSGRLANWRVVQRERFDLLMTIDYNLGYSVYLRSLPRTPAIIWIRDPRSAEDARKIESTRMPGAPDEIPQGLYSFDSRSIARIVKESHWFRRPVLFATQAPHLITRLEGAYDLEPWEVYFLPNDLRLNPPVVVKSERPTVVFLGRLDPVKRPWIFAELARHFPYAEFRFLGQSHFAGPGSWRPENLPANVRLLGHVNEEEKVRLLSEAWVAVNTSIHEAVAVSMLEALACETPLLSSVNPGFMVSRYGIYAGRFDGDGMQGLAAFRLGLQTLLDNRELRRDLGARGRTWIRSTHTRERFLECFWRLCERAGVRR